MRTTVLVVEDSLTVRRHLVGVLSSDPVLEVVGEAADGKAAIEMCLRLRPDVVTLDMHLPILSGLAVTEYIMAYCPTPILIVSASVNRGDLYETYDALAAGAVDILEKPTGGESGSAWEQVFLSTVKLVSRIKVITHMSGRLQNRRATSTQAVCPDLLQIKPLEAYRLVAMGASTGGPAALATVLRCLPADFPLPILIVIHITPPFGLLMADWLDSQSPLSVVCATDGARLPDTGQGRVILAPAGCHIVIRNGVVRLVDDDERHSCRPSVEVLFESVARELGPRSIACLMTGMGKDGAEGLLAVRRAGGRTLVQDEATSVVFGMPQQAIRLGAAERVLALDEIAPALLSMAAGGRPCRSISTG